MSEEYGDRVVTSPPPTEIEFQQVISPQLADHLVQLTRQYEKDEHKLFGLPQKRGIRLASGLLGSLFAVGVVVSIVLGLMPLYLPAATPELVAGAAILAARPNFIHNVNSTNNQTTRITSYLSTESSQISSSTEAFTLTESQLVETLLASYKSSTSSLSDSRNESNPTTSSVVSESINSSVESVLKEPDEVSRHVSTTTSSLMPSTTTSELTLFDFKNINEYCAYCVNTRRCVHSINCQETCYIECDKKIFDASTQLTTIITNVTISSQFTNRDNNKTREKKKKEE